MTSKKPAIIETSNDYSVINRYVDNVLERHKDLLSFRRANRLRIILLALSAVLIAIGVALFLYFWGLAILEKAKKAPSQQSTIEDIIKSSDVPADNRTNQAKQVTVEYVIFKTVSLSEGAVVSGWRYDPDDPSVPKYQYCYFDISAGGPHSKNTHLASKLRDESVIWERDVSSDLRRLAKSHCKFQ